MKSEEILGDPQTPPTDIQIETFLGKKAYGYWESLSGWISDSYPSVFSREWLFGGKKHGWYHRYKKSKSFCQFIPRNGKFILLIVFGVKERDEIEKVADSLNPTTKTEYEKACTYHDGKWLFLPIKNREALNDAKKLLSTKRKIRASKNTSPVAGVRPTC